MVSLPCSKHCSGFPSHSGEKPKAFQWLTLHSMSCHPLKLLISSFTYTASYSFPGVLFSWCFLKMLIQVSTYFAFAGSSSWNTLTSDIMWLILSPPSRLGSNTTFSIKPTLSTLFQIAHPSFPASPSTAILLALRSLSSSHSFLYPPFPPESITICTMTEFTYIWFIIYLSPSLECYNSKLAEIFVFSLTPHSF